MGTQRIALVEPQMTDVFHTAINAGLLHTVALSHPGDLVSFRGFSGHVKIIRQILQTHAPDVADRVEWRTIDSVPSSLLTRWRHNHELLRQVLATRERVLFASISRLQLIQLKQMMRRSDQVRAVLHGDLEQIESPSQGQFPWNHFTLRKILLGWQPEGLRYLLLGQSILEHLPLEFRERLPLFGVADLVYHFEALETLNPGPIVFGLFGNAGDGALLHEVAVQTQRLNAGIEFRLVGYVGSRAASDRLQVVVKDVSDFPISPQVFADRARAITYALWLAPTGKYRLRASSAFFDALAYGKPIIYTGNPFVDSYFFRAPQIGFRCERLDDVPSTILAVQERHSNQSYAIAQEAILRLRSFFTPTAAAERLPAALAWT